MHLPGTKFDVTNFVGAVCKDGERDPKTEKFTFLTKYLEYKRPTGVHLWHNSHKICTAIDSLMGDQLLQLRWVWKLWGLFRRMCQRSFIIMWSLVVIRLCMMAGEPTTFVFLYPSIVLLNGQVYESYFAMKMFELRNGLTLFDRQWFVDVQLCTHVRLCLPAAKCHRHRMLKLKTAKK